MTSNTKKSGYMEIPSPFQGAKHTFHKHLAAAYMVAEEVWLGVTAVNTRLQTLGRPGKVPVVKDGTYVLFCLNGLGSRLGCDDKSCQRHHTQLYLGLKVQHLPKSWSRDLPSPANEEPCLEILLMEDCIHNPTNGDDAAEKSTTFCIPPPQGQFLKSSLNTCVFFPDMLLVVQLAFVFQVHQQCPGGVSQLPNNQDNCSEHSSALGHQFVFT